MNAIILSVGDELVLGQTVDTNSAWLSQQLAAVGCEIASHQTVPDDQKAIENAIREALGRCDYLIISGGIGPTEDDLTRQALAAVLRVPLELNEAWLAKLEAFFANLGRAMPITNRTQAMIPQGATMIENTAGTAAGIDVTIGSPRQLPPKGGAVSIDQLQGRPIGRVLTKMSKVTREQVVEALTIQKNKGGGELLGQILVALGYVSASDVEAALRYQRGDPTQSVTPSLPLAPPLTPLVSDEHMEQMWGPDEVQRRKYQQQFGQFTMQDIIARQMRLGLRKSGTRIFVMPGVPKEMKIMFTRDVLPHIQQAGGGGVILSRTLHTFGLGESSVAEKLGDLMKRDRNPSVGTTVSQGIVSLRINARFPSRDEAQMQLDATTEKCRAALGDLIFGADDESLPAVVAGLFKRKSEISNQKSQTITTAESCTGGLLAKMLTDIPGSSDFFKQGWVTYSNKAKTDRLGVSENILNVHGAVSEPVVEAMAKAACRLARSDYALTISGIAGPAGGTENKPVGTVCIALVEKDAIIANRTFLFTGDREMIRDRSAKMALTMLRFHLLGKPLPF